MEEVGKYNYSKKMFIFVRLNAIMLSKDDILTLKAVILFILKKSKEDKRDVYSVVKTAFYAQQLHFKEYGLPLFKDQINALPFGPVPSNVYDILQMARGEENKVTRFHDGEDLSIASSSIEFEFESFSAKENPDMDYLSKSAIECLDAAISKVSKMSFDEIKADTHGEEWNRVFYGNSKSKVMDNLKIAEEAGAEAGAIDYLEDYLCRV